MIPRLIHRIWIEGSPPAPPHFIRSGLLWQQLNPGWTVQHWAGPDFRMTNACLYRRAPSNDSFRYRSDLLRLELLYRYGGVYVDMDIEPLRPLGDLLDDCTCAIAPSPNPWKGKTIVSNAFIASVPGHPFIKRCIDAMKVSVQQFRGEFLAMMTGPHHVNRCLRDGDDVVILNRKKIYPVTRSELPEAYCFHSWANRAKLKKEALR